MRSEPELVENPRLSFAIMHLLFLFSNFFFFGLSVFLLFALPGTVLTLRHGGCFPASAGLATFRCFVHHYSDRRLYVASTLLPSRIWRLLFASYVLKTTWSAP